MPKSLGSEEPGKCRPTPANYLEALDPNRGQILPFALGSAAEIKSPVPPISPVEVWIEISFLHILLISKNSNFFWLLKSYDLFLHLLKLMPITFIAVTK